MRYLALLLLVVFGGCAAFTPAGVQSGIAKMNRDLPILRAVVASITTNQKLLSDLDLIVSNTNALDTIANH